MTYTWNNTKLSLCYDPEHAALQIAVDGSEIAWAWTGAPFIRLFRQKGGEKIQTNVYIYII